MSNKIDNQFACSRLILPEHRDQLRHYGLARQKEKENRLPCLDQQQWEEFEIRIKKSLRQALPIKITAVNKGGRYSITGVVIKVDPLNEKIVLVTAQGVQQVESAEITGVAHFQG